MDQLARSRQGRDGQRPSTPAVFLERFGGREARNLPDVSILQAGGTAPGVGCSTCFDGLSKMRKRGRNVVWLKLSGYTHGENRRIVDVHKDTIDRYWNKACPEILCGNLRRSWIELH